MYLKRDISWDGFFIDFGSVSGGAGEAKKWFWHWSGYNFEIFTSPNISYLLEWPKPQFWEPFGGSSWVPKMCKMAPRGVLGRITKLF